MKPILMKKKSQRLDIKLLIQVINNIFLMNSVHNILIYWELNSKLIKILMVLMLNFTYLQCNYFIYLLSETSLLIVSQATLNFD